jgi:uncharacterized protein
VITEVVYLIATRLGTEAEVRFLGDLAAGNLLPEPVAAGDWLRIAELTARYRDLPLGTVDASVVTTAERLGATEIATTDRRHSASSSPPSDHSRSCPDGHSQWSTPKPCHPAAGTLMASSATMSERSLPLAPSGPPIQDSIQDSRRH